MSTVQIVPTCASMVLMQPRSVGLTSMAGTLATGYLRAHRLFFGLQYWPRTYVGSQHFIVRWRHVSNWDLATWPDVCGFWLSEAEWGSVWVFLLRRRQLPSPTPVPLLPGVFLCPGLCWSSTGLAGHPKVSKLVASVKKLPFTGRTRWPQFKTTRQWPQVGMQVLPWR